MKKLYLMGILTVLMILAVQTAAASFLQITEIDIKVDGDKESCSTSGCQVQVEPGDDLEIKIEVTNIYPSGAADDEITDVEVEGDIEDIDDGDDLEPEDEPDEEDLDDSGDDKTFTLEYEIPLRVDEDTFDLDITVEGRNGSSVLQVANVTIEIEVDKEKHLLYINRAEFDRPTLACGKSTDFNAQIFNIGSEEEEDVELTVRNEDFEVDFSEIFDIDEGGEDDDTEFSRAFRVSIPDTAKAGIYDFITQVTYRDGRESEKESTELQVICDAEKPAPTVTTPKPTVVTTQPTTTTTTTTPTTTPTVTVPTVTTGPNKATSKNSDGSLGWIIAGYVVGIIILIALIGLIVRNKREYFSFNLFFLITFFNSNQKLED